MVADPSDTRCLPFQRPSSTFAPCSSLNPALPSAPVAARHVNRHGRRILLCLGAPEVGQGDRGCAVWHGRGVLSGCLRMVAVVRDSLSSRLRSCLSNTSLDEEIPLVRSTRSSRHHAYLTSNQIIRAPWTAMKFAYLFCRCYYLIYWPLMLWAFVGNHDYSLCLGLTRPVNALLMPMVRSCLPQPLGH